jgi:hypothetical protein
LSNWPDSVGQRHDRADEQQHKVRFHYLGPRSAISPPSASGCRRRSLPNLFGAPETALHRLRSLVRACFKSTRSPTSSELAQKCAKRGNIAKAFAIERANFRDGGDGHAGLTITYVATSGLTSQGPLPPPCSADRSSRDPVLPRVSFDMGTWGRWHSATGPFCVVCPNSRIADAGAWALPHSVNIAARTGRPSRHRRRRMTRLLGFMPGIHVLPFLDSTKT